MQPRNRYLVVAGPHPRRPFFSRLGVWCVSAILALCIVGMLPMLTRAAQDQTATTVQGPGTENTAITGTPLGLGLKDNAGKLQFLQGDASFNLKMAVNAALPAGTAVIGKVSIDQTTPGTTDSVTVATAQGAGLNIGLQADAAVGDATGTLNAHLRQTAKILTANLPAPGQAVMASSVPVTIASNQGAITTQLPTTLGAKTTANSTAVTIASDQGAITTQLPTAIGQTTMAGSTSVTIASNQGAITTQLPTALVTSADGQTAAAALETTSRTQLYNGATSDRFYSNWQQTGIASTVYNSATTTNGSDLTNFNGRGLAVLFDVTAFTAAGTSTTVNIQVKAGSDYATIASFVPTVSATGLLTMGIYPGALSPGSWSVAPLSSMAPRTFRVQVVTVGSVNYTATIYVQEML